MRNGLTIHVFVFLFHRPSVKRVFSDTLKNKGQCMARNKNPEKLQAWFDKQSEVDRRVIALNAVNRLIEIEEVWFREADGDDDDPVGLYWESCGDDLRIPF